MNSIYQSIPNHRWAPHKPSFVGHILVVYNQSCCGQCVQTKIIGTKGKIWERQKHKRRVRRRSHNQWRKVSLCQNEVTCSVLHQRSQLDEITLCHAVSLSLCLALFLHLSLFSSPISLHLVSLNVFNPIRQP